MSLSDSPEPRQFRGRIPNAEMARRRLEAAKAEMAKYAPQVASPLPVASVMDGVESPDRLPPRRVTNPFGSMTQKMARPERPGYRCYWFNDEPGRINQAKLGGYEHVLKDGAPETHPVGVSNTGGVLLAYLMEIPEQYYKEDMAAQQDRVDEMEKAYRRGADEHGKPGQDGRYIPAPGIKIQSA